MKIQHGEFSITAISYLNNVVSAIDSDAYKEASNKEMVQIVELVKGDRKEETAAWDGYNALSNIYSVDELKEFAKTSTKGNIEYYKYLIEKTIRIGTMNIGINYVENENSNHMLNYNYLGQLSLPITFSAVYIILGISIIYLIWYLIKKKDIDWILAFFTVLILANLFTLIVGAPFESQRLFVGSIVLVLLLISYVVGKIDKKGEEDEKVNV